MIINIPKPCSENWEGMTPVDKGRFCASCQKTVIDFTLMSDVQIVDIIKKTTANELCGHLDASQLGREMIANEKRSLFSNGVLSKIAASLLLFQTLVTTAWAQTVKPKIHTISKPYTKRIKPTLPSIKGTITEADNAKPIKGITIHLVELDKQCTTDTSGSFEFTIPDNIKTALTLTASYDSVKADIYIPDVTIAPSDIYSKKEISMLYYRQHMLPAVMDSATIYTQSTFSGAIPIRDVVSPPKKKRFSLFHKKNRQ